MNTNKKAQDIWNAIKKDSLGDIRAQALIEIELNKALIEEREAIVDTLAQKFKFKDSFKLNIWTYFYMVFMPKTSFMSLVQGVVGKSITIIRDRVFN